MRTLEEVIERDQRLFERFENSFSDNLARQMMEGRHPKTFMVVLSFIAKMGFLKTAIIDMCAADNPYAVNVLYRSFIEHFLRVQAIFITAISEDSDDFANQYMKLSLVEGFDYIKACEAAGLVEKPQTESFKKKVSEAHGLTEKEIRALAEPFKHRNLVKRIKSKMRLEGGDFISKAIPTYSELSSFVHGGPDSTFELMKASNEEERKVEMARIADIVVSMFYAIESLSRAVYVEQKPK